MKFENRSLRSNYSLLTAFPRFKSQRLNLYVYFLAESHGSWAWVESSKRGEICELQMLSSASANVVQCCITTLPFLYSHDLLELHMTSIADTRGTQRQGSHIRRHWQCWVCCPGHRQVATFSIFLSLFSDAIASPCSHPSQWVSQCSDLKGLAFPRLASFSSFDTFFFFIFLWLRDCEILTAAADGRKSGGVDGFWLSMDFNEYCWRIFFVGGF